MWQSYDESLLCKFADRHQSAGNVETEWYVLKPK